MLTNCNDIPKRVYTEEEIEMLHKMLDELIASGDVCITYQTAKMDWDLPSDNKVKIKRYRIHLAIDDR